MKRKLMAVVISMCMAFSAMGTVYADDLTASDSSDQEQTTEAETETEKETEAETEKVTEKATEAATEKATEATTKKSEVKTEATTSSTTTTTKKTSTSSDKNDKNVKESKSVTVNVDSTKDLGDYLSDTAPDAASFDWSTSDDSIARVTSMGKLTGEKKGTCTVTATAEKSGTKYTYTFNITVKSSSSSDKKSISIDVDEEKDLYKYVDDDYSASKYDWESSDTKYVKVSTRGVVTGVKEGSATVTATYESGSTSLEYKFKVTVGSDDSSSSKSSKVSEKTSWDIYVGRGDDVDISLILEDDPDEYDWSVDDEDIAEIDEDDGIITGVDEGETDIEAEGDTDYKFTVYVGRDYSTEEITIKGKDTYDLDDILDVDDYSFKSDRKAVATVNSKGVVTGVANGVATIICENEDDEDEIIQVFVTVKNISTTTTKTTTTEATTETTTAAKATQNTTTAVSFSDISHRAWAVDSIKAMASKGYIVGVGKDKFSPDANCKRCDFTIVLMKILGLDNDEDASSEYDDISPSKYYYNYVMTALANGIEAGVKNNEFRPDDYITREEMMVMVYKGLVKVSGELNTDTAVLNKFTDASEIAEENKAAVAALINSGAISGTSDTTLEPKANITRAQMAVIMNKVDNR